MQKEWMRRLVSHCRWKPSKTWYHNLHWEHSWSDRKKQRLLNRLFSSIDTTLLDTDMLEFLWCRVKTETGLDSIVMFEDMMPEYYSLEILNSNTWSQDQASIVSEAHRSKKVPQVQLAWSVLSKLLRRLNHQICLLGGRIFQIGVRSKINILNTKNDIEVLKSWILKSKVEE